MRTTDGAEAPDDGLVRNGPQRSPLLTHIDDGITTAASMDDLRTEAAVIWAGDAFEWLPPTPDDDRGAIAESEDDAWA